MVMRSLWGGEGGNTTAAVRGSLTGGHCNVSIHYVALASHPPAVLEKRLTEGATDVLGAGLRPAVASARAVAAVAERLGALEERLGTRAAEEQVREARR